MEDPAPEVTTAVDELTNPNWVTRQRAADTLRVLGKQAAPALPALEQALASDDDYDVREAAVKASWPSRTTPSSG